MSGRYGLQKRFNDGSGLGGPLSASPISTTAFQIVAVLRNRIQGPFEMWVNGVMEATEPDSGGALTPDPIDIGRHATAAAGGLNGDIAELLIYRSELTEADFQAVGTYLEAEYGIDTAFGVATPLSPAAPTSYLRKSFTFPGDPARTTLRLSHTIADGAVFYLNGAELVRHNMPNGAITHTTAASSIITNPSVSGFTPVPAGSLVNGTNVLAVSLHKAVASPGVLFDAALESTETPSIRTLEGAGFFSEISGANDAGFYVELRNPRAAHRYDGLDDPGEHLVRPSRFQRDDPPGGFLTLNAAAGIHAGRLHALFIIRPAD